MQSLVYKIVVIKSVWTSIILHRMVIWWFTLSIFSSVVKPRNEVLISIIIIMTIMTPNCVDEEEEEGNDKNESRS